MDKNYKNGAERECAEVLSKEGWEITKRGWPDFFCNRNGELILVEVKKSRYQALKGSQYRLMSALSEHGIECYLWNPEEGFVSIFAKKPTRPL